MSSFISKREIRDGIPCYGAILKSHKFLSLNICSSSSLESKSREFAFLSYL